MNDEDIDDLVARLRRSGNQGSVFWYDRQEQRCLEVVGVNRDWVEYPGAPPEPAAMLANSAPVALMSCEREDFVSLSPCI